MTGKKITSLSEFIARVARLRAAWGVPQHKEIWFRGERGRYRREKTFLRPELYRPRRGKRLRPIRRLLEVENEFYEEFKRCVFQFSNDTAEKEEWEWDSYFLMQHHSAPTRLLDWSDGALIALHFAVRSNSQDDGDDSIIYVLEPDRLNKELEKLPDEALIKDAWKEYVAKHPSDDLSDDDWERSYLPGDADELRELVRPAPPLLLDFPHITRRVAAQRSRFMIFGTDPDWLASRLGTRGFPVREIYIAGQARKDIRLQLRDAGITESVIFPDMDGLGREIRQLWLDRK